MGVAYKCDRCGDYFNLSVGRCNTPENYAKIVVGKFNVFNDRILNFENEPVIEMGLCDTCLNSLKKWMNTYKKEETGNESKTDDQKS